MHDNRHARSPMIITTALYRTRMANIFIRVCVLIYIDVSMASHHRPSLTTSAINISRKRQRSSRVSSHLRLDAVATKQRRAAWLRPLGPHGTWMEQTH